MKVERRTVARIERPYSLCVLGRDARGRPTFAAGSEAEGGPLLLFAPPGYEPRTLADGPGGFICLWPFRAAGAPAILAVTRFYPEFDSADARLCVFPLDGQEGIEVGRVPYAHRIALCEAGGAACLLVSTLCSGKAFKEDWSRPGEVLVAEVPPDASLRSVWPLRPIATGLTHNHGMEAARLGRDGRDGFLLSADEGLFFLRVPDDPAGDWPVDTLAEGRHSDAVAHVAPDGEALLFTISPFHGHELAMYEGRQAGRRRRVIADDLEFGHIVWAGELCGRRVLLAGGRGGRRELRVYDIGTLRAGGDSYETLDEGVGAAQLAVVPCGGRAATIIITAHGAGELRLYDVVGDRSA